jgi:lipid-binding SYLF domain-containing protein|nr:YSC84-related protein [uncultured Undibacterium sp.]
MIQISLVSRRLFAGILAIGILSGCATTQGNNPSEKRQAVQTMRDSALVSLYKTKPEAKAKVDAAYGTAVFSTANVNLLIASFSGGYGIAKDRSGKQTYMRMAEAGIGLGAGVKDVRTIFIFHSQKAFEQFVNSGWEFGAHADAAAKAGDKGAAVGGEVSVAGMTIYQITEAGLALQATIKGTKFYKDDELN